jgi:hypothetical protein
MREGTPRRFSGSRFAGNRLASLLAGAVLAAGLGGFFQPREARGALIASDTASDPAYSSGWTNGSNGGSGFGAWQLSPTTNSGTGGFFIGDSTQNGGGGSGASGSSLGINTPNADAFGIYANSGTTSNAYRPLTFPLSVLQTISFSIDNGYVNNPGSVGISLLAGGSSGAVRFEFYFNGGTSDYTIQDATGTHDSGIGYTDGGLSLALTATSASTYSLSVAPANGGSTSNFTGTFAGTPSSSDIDTFRAFDYNSSNNTAGNFYINSIAVPEPTAVTLMVAAGALLLVRTRRAAESAVIR